MKSRKGYVLFETNTELSDEAIFNQKVISTGNTYYAGVYWKEYPEFETHGTVIYNDGIKIDLGTVPPNNGGYFTWQNGYIYKFVRIDKFPTQAFNIQKRTNENIDLNYKNMGDIFF